MDHLTRTLYPDGTYISNVYNALGYPIATRDRAGYWTTNTYDAAGHVLSVIHPNGDIIQKKYCGNLVTNMIDGRGNVTHFFYDHEQLVGVQFPDGSKRAAGFDNLNRQIWSVDERGVAVSNVYDKLSRTVYTEYWGFDNDELQYLPTTTELPTGFSTPAFDSDYIDGDVDQTIENAYDEVGNVTWSISWSSTNHYTYDGLNRVTGQVVTNKLTLPQWLSYEYAYDIIGSRTNMSVALEGVTNNYTYAYDELNRMKSLGFTGFDQSISANYQYKPNGKMFQTLVTNNSTLVSRSVYAYDGEQRLDTLTSSNANARLLSLDYTYNDAQQISQIVEVLNGTSKQYDFLYDKREQLVREIKDSVYRTEYEYDHAQNRTRREVYDPNATKTDDGIYAYMSANTLSALTNHSESSNPLYRRPERPYTHYYYYTYDLAGNLTQRVVNGKANCYTYNAQNKLARILGDGFTNEFMCDSGNRRIALSNNTWRYFIHDGNIPIAEVDANTNITRWFVRGIGIAAGTGDVLAEIVPTGTTETIHFYMTNHRGDTLMTLTNSGNIETSLRYDAFGKNYQKNGTFTPRYTFSAKEYLSDAILYLYAYRVYDPIAGRWTQRDPIGFQDSENLYQFCGNNPLNAWDPFGLEIIIEGDSFFRDDVNEAIEEISKSIFGRRFIEKIRKTKHKYIIKRYTEEGRNASSAGRNLNDRSKSNVFWDNKSTTGGRDDEGSKNCPNFIALTHELGHAYADEHNLEPPKPRFYKIKLHSTPAWEKWAMRFENKIRKKHKITKRSHYWQ